MYITHVPYFRIQPDFSYSFETWRCLDRARGVETNAQKCDDMKGYLPMQLNHFHCCSQGLQWVLSTGCQKKWWSCRDSNAGRVISSNQNEQTSPRQVPDKSRKSLGKVPENPRKIHNFLLFFSFVLRRSKSRVITNFTTRPPMTDPNEWIFSQRMSLSVLITCNKRLKNCQNQPIYTLESVTVWRAV